MGLNRKPEEISDGVGLLISILLRYPEVGTINYEPEANMLKFVFVLSREISPEQWICVKHRLRSSMETFNLLEGRKVRACNLDYVAAQGLTIVEIGRDAETLVQEEISLLVGLMKQEFLGDLVVDEQETAGEEDLLMQEEYITRMLESIRGVLPPRKVIAFREKGRVMVFNK